MIEETHARVPVVLKVYNVTPGSLSVAVGEFSTLESFVDNCDVTVHAPKHDLVEGDRCGTLFLCYQQPWDEDSSSRSPIIACYGAISLPNLSRSEADDIIAYLEEMGITVVRTSMANAVANVMGDAASGAVILMPEVIEETVARRREVQK